MAQATDERVRLTERIIDELWQATEVPFYKQDLVAALADVLFDARVDLRAVSLEDVKSILLDKLAGTPRALATEPCRSTSC